MGFNRTSIDFSSSQKIFVVNGCKERPCEVLETPNAASDR